jgi:Cu/Ag efflux pump CusA
MIDRLIELSLRNKFLVVMIWIGIAGWGVVRQNLSRDQRRGGFW